MKNIAFLSLLLLHTLFNSVKATPDPDRENRVQNLLLLSLEELMQIEITTAGKIAEKIGEIPASVVLITRKEIQRYGYTTLDEILRHVSGMYHLNFYGAAGNAFGIRGYLSTASANKNIIILINGINKVSDYDSSYFLSATSVPVEAIDRIEVIRGPQSTIYGSGAFFGVINIITNEVNQKEGSESYVSLATGSRHSNRYFGRTSYAFDQGKIITNVGNYREDGLDVPYSRLETKFMGLEANLSTKDRLANKQKYLDLSGSYKDVYFGLIHTDTNTKGFVSRPTINDGTFKKLEETHLRLGYKKDFSERLIMDSKLTYAHHRSYVRYDAPFPVNTFDFQDEYATAYEGEITLQWKASKQFDLTSGLYYRRTPNVRTYVDLPGLPSATAFQKSSQNLASGEALVNEAIFSQLNYHPDKHWKLTAGLRLEKILGYDALVEYGATPATYKQAIAKYADQKLAVIPRFAAIYTPNQEHIFKLMYGKAITAPSFGQNTTSRVEGNLPPLKVEQIETYEFNYITYLSPRYMLSANLFHNRLNNLLERLMRIDQSGNYTSFLGNGGKWSTNGIELGLQARPTNDTTLEIGVTYQQTKDANRPEIEPAYSPNILGQFKLSYQFDKQLSFALTNYYVSKMEVFFDPSLKNPDGTFGRRINGTPSKSYLVTGANLRYQDWLSKGTFLNLRINNLFNQEITYPTFTRNNWIDKGSVGEERNFMLTLGYEF
jgi:outer membrane receptor for ferrienterochelin and colicins